MSRNAANVFISHVHEDDSRLGVLKSLMTSSGLDVRDGSINSDKPNAAKSEAYIKSSILGPRNVHLANIDCNSRPRPPALHIQAHATPGRRPMSGQRPSRQSLRKPLFRACKWLMCSSQKMDWAQSHSHALLHKKKAAYSLLSNRNEGFADAHEEHLPAFPNC